MAGALDELEVAGQIAETKRRQTTLPLAEQFARAPQSQILLGDAEAVGRFLQNLESPPRFIGPDVGDEDAPGLMSAAPDASVFSPRFRQFYTATR